MELLYLKNFLKRFINSLSKKDVIPLSIAESEKLVRGILHPMFYSDSKGVIKEEAFLPPPGSQEVSLLRHNYTNDNFCKLHSRSLKVGINSTYRGLAVLTASLVIELNNEIASEKLSAVVVATPLDEQGNYIKKAFIYRNDSGIPMHADLKYSKPVLRGEPNTLHRAYAKMFIKSKGIKYYSDPDPTLDAWTGEKL